MTLDEIKAAVDAGRPCIGDTGYIVHKDRLGQYLITYVPNGSCIGLTDRSGQRLNGKKTEFFIARSEDGAENPGSQSRPNGQGRRRRTRRRGGIPTRTAALTRGRG